MRNILKSRRGIAIELAIFVIILTAALSIIILTTAIHESQASKQARSELAESVALAEIGELALKNFGNYENNDYTVSYENEDYTISYEDTKEDGKITVEKDGKTVLKIETEGGVISKWD